MGVTTAFHFVSLFIVLETFSNGQQELYLSYIIITIISIQPCLPAECLQHFLTSTFLHISFCFEILVTDNEQVSSNGERRRNSESKGHLEQFSTRYRSYNK